jgi:hypothetical protein
MMIRLYDQSPKGRNNRREELFSYVAFVSPLQTRPGRSIFPFRIALAIAQSAVYASRWDCFKSLRRPESGIDYGLTIRLIFVQPVIQDMFAACACTSKNCALKLEGDDLVSMIGGTSLQRQQSRALSPPQAELGTGSRQGSAWHSTMHRSRQRSIHDACAARSYFQAIGGDSYVQSGSYSEVIA